MSVQYRPVNWNANKWAYDAVIAACVAVYLAVFWGVGRFAWSGSEQLGDVELLIRGLGTCAFVMLHMVLCLGPLARLDRRFLPLVYNRRHLGVATFLVGLAHGVLVTGYYHGFGAVNPLVSLLTSNAQAPARLPFEWLGLAALVILFLLASTSHDFWQKALGASAWKALHMAIYAAYGLLVLHVAFGAMQAEKSIAYPVLLSVGAATVAGLHLATAWRERRRDQIIAPGASDQEAPQDIPWLDAGSIDDLRDGRARIICPPGGERIAVFRHGWKASAVTNVCAHQRGPLGEGKIVDGCITCPWHGWEYRPENGQSPPPFAERIATYRVRAAGRRILVDPRPLPAGTAAEPAEFAPPDCEESHVPDATAACCTADSR